MTPQQRLLGQSALQAFRSDIIPGAAAATPEDQAAILVATLLRQSLSVGAEPITSRLRDEAIRMARISLGDDALAQGCTYDDHFPRSSTDVVRLLVQRTDHAGRFSLALHLLESIAEIEVDPIQSGRILWDRGRVNRKLGYLDLAVEQFHTILREGRRNRSSELVAKAHYALAAVAEMRGNFVEFRARARTVLRMAKANRLTKLQAAGHSALGLSHAVAHRYGDAVSNLWKAYQLTGGQGQISRSALGNLSQTLLISGRPIEARKVATVQIQESCALINVLPALGTYSLASAQLGDPVGVRWSATQIERLSATEGHQREIAESLMECAAALEAIGEGRRGDIMKRRAEIIANQYGFHDLTFQEAMLSVKRVSKQPAFGAAAEKATAAIEEMEVPQIPELLAALPS